MLFVCTILYKVIVYRSPCPLGELLFVARSLSFYVEITYEITALGTLFLDAVIF